MRTYDDIKTMIDSVDRAVQTNQNLLDHSPIPVVDGGKHVRAIKVENLIDVLLRIRAHFASLKPDC